MCRKPPLAQPTDLSAYLCLPLSLSVGEEMMRQLLRKHSALSSSLNKFKHVGFWGKFGKNKGLLLSVTKGSYGAAQSQRVAISWSAHFSCLNH